MYEYIFSTIVLFYKTITFFVVEPFDGSVMQFCHCNTFCFEMVNQNVGESSGSSGATSNAATHITHEDDLEPHLSSAVIIAVLFPYGKCFENISGISDGNSIESGRNLPCLLCIVDKDPDSDSQVNAEV